MNQSPTKKLNQVDVVQLQKPGIPLPSTPGTTSRVPHLTSIHAVDGRGPYGNAGFRGNCSGLIIEDLLRYYRPDSVLDPMTGSGTCRDVCDALGIRRYSLDLSQGFDAANPTHYENLPNVDCVWLHPPYWKMIRFSQDRRCLAEAATYAEFLERWRIVLANCLSRLSPGGHLMVLIGDGKENGVYLGMPFRTLQIAETLGLWLAAPEIIRFGHGATSSKKQYSSNFIPRLHDVCFVLKRKSEIAKYPSDKKILDVFDTPWHLVPTLSRKSCTVRYKYKAYAVYKSGSNTAWTERR